MGALKESVKDILFVEGDLDIKEESFGKVVETDKNILTYSYLWRSPDAEKLNMLVDKFYKDDKSATNLKSIQSYINISDANIKLFGLIR